MQQGAEGLRECSMFTGSVVQQAGPSCGQASPRVPHLQRCIPAQVALRVGVERLHVVSWVCQGAIAYSRKLFVPVNAR